MNTLRKIGKLGKPLGIAGDIRLAVNEQWLFKLEESDVFFLELEQKKIPYFIEDLDLDRSTCRFEDVNSKEAAKDLAGASIYLEVDDAEVEEMPISVSDEWLGFKVIDESLGEIGVIVDMILNLKQWIAVINYESKGKEVMIPLEESLITDIEPSSKTITMDLPEGILDL